MMPWREQLRLGWRIAAWFVWPVNRVWANVCYLLLVAAIDVSIASGFLWGVALGLAGIVVLAFTATFTSGAGPGTGG
jgi:hypothetical protein